MKAATLKEYRELARMHSQHRSAKIIVELCDAVEKLQNKKQPNVPESAEVHCYGNDIELSAEERAAFTDHHLARGWRFKDGTPVRDWRAAMRTWKRNNAKFAKRDGLIVVDKSKVPDLNKQREARQLKERKHHENLFNDPCASAV